MRMTELKTYFDSHAAKMLDGDMADAAARFTYPAAIYVLGAPLVLASPTEACAALSLFRHHVVEDGIGQMSATIDVAELPRRGRQRVWVTWSFIDAGGQVKRQDKVTYILRGADTPVTAKIEMMDYTQLAFPDLMQVLPLAR